MTMPKMIFSENDTVKKSLNDLEITEFLCLRKIQTPNFL